MRPSGRAPDQMRELRFEPGFTKHAEGSCLVSFGDTRVLVTASVKVPLEVKEAWSREAARRGIKLSEHLRQMLQLVDQSWTEADKACPPEHAQRGKQPRRERRMGCAIARPWSPEHAAMLGAMLQIHAQLRNAGDAGQPASTAELIELNARLAQIHRRVESLCWDRVMRRSARSGEA